MYYDFEEIIEKITERYETPVRVAHNCESNTYYRVEDLDTEELEICAAVLAERVRNICTQGTPKVIFHLSSYSELAHLLKKELEMFAKPGEKIEVVSLHKVSAANEELAQKVKQKKALIVNEVITTGRSCLEAHSRVTMMGANVLCWATIVDRTFGPGPVSVAAAVTGEPIALLE